jgi:hypothetical protein
MNIYRLVKQFLAGHSNRKIDAQKTTVTNSAINSIDERKISLENLHIPTLPIPNPIDWDEIDSLVDQNYRSWIVDKEEGDKKKEQEQGISPEPTPTLATIRAEKLNRLKAKSLQHG